MQQQDTHTPGLPPTPRNVAAHLCQWYDVTPAAAARLVAKHGTTFCRTEPYGGYVYHIGDRIAERERLTERLLPHVR